MGQRTDAFRGGVQSGTTACSAESVSLEQALRAAAAEVAGDVGELEWIPGFTAAELSDLLGVPAGHITGVSPDGGIWVARDSAGVPRVVAEAKKQGVAGNAIERWFKNWSVFRRLGVGTYVTFCSGDGFFDQNSAQRTLETAVALEPDEAHRLSDDTVWNTPTGRLWLYRYRRAGNADDIADVLRAAIRRQEPGR